MLQYSLFAAQLYDAILFCWVGGKYRFLKYMYKIY